ncbi:RHS repeat-associated core domain-containing protein [Chryseobacterium oranimense]|uniref:RHS repeat-associated core domain-containing protein n=1 Tax=Chryseobacterium oranimense TaxID=421058 RepID=UPI0022355F38|nr:RHS repeat-associated core domain-containing protein [Chryseobacterium oranimense]
MKKYWLFIIACLCTALPLTAQNLTQTENYIYSRTYLEPVTTSSSSAKQTQEVSYFDGLGRPKQSIAIKATPSGKDLVTPVEYDDFGRQVKDMLPLPQQNTNSGGIFTSPDITGAVSIYGNASNYYGEKKLENSPLNRLEEQAAPGEPWKMGSGKTIKYTYQSNNDSEVKKFVANTTWTTVSNIAVGTPALSISAENTAYVSGGFYKAGTLYKNSITDEDGNTAVKYTNGKGQTVLVRKNDGTQNIDTYYVYNEYGQQVFVLLPAAVKAIEAENNTISTSTLDNFCYQYRYDNQDRLVEKKFPGKGWEYMVYDQQDRLVLMQDANLRTTTNNFNAKGWIFTKYDQFGRMAYSGFFANTATRQVMQYALNSMVSNAQNNEKRDDLNPFVQNGENIYYTKLAFPTGSMTILSVNYYDTYPPVPSGSSPVSRPVAILGQATLTSAPVSMTVNGVTTSRSSKGLPTATYVRNIEDTNWTKDYFWYDTKGRSIGSHSINHLGGFTKTETELDFTGVPKQTITYHKRKDSEAGVTVRERFDYDPQNRLVKHWHQVDSRPEELLAENTYNELSQLTNKKVGNSLQSIDYAYNIRGWLTDINKNQMALPDLGGKLFSYKVKYNQKDGIDNPDPAQFPGKTVKAKYNGNIAEIDWRAVETVGVNPSLTPKRYGYAYDPMNRLSAGFYQNPLNPYSKENTESMDYDISGNIKKLYRTSVIGSGTNTATLIDNLEYIYTGSNLNKVNDYAYNPTGYEGGGAAIGYDANGNMLSIPDKGIFPIRYNYLNLPSSMEINRNGSEYITINTKYGADGTKLRKENTTVITGFNGSTTTKKTTDYLDGFQYLLTENIGTGGGSSEDFSLSGRAMQPEAFSADDIAISVAAKTPDLQFFPTAEGFYDYQKDQYIYQYNDLMGNVRVSFTRNSAGALEIVDANDYYPFGMNHMKTGNAFFAQGSYKSYKFVGNELQETGFYDMNARFFMPDLGIFGQHDPLSGTTLDPYGYAYNNPIMFADPSGLEGEPIPEGSGPGNPQVIGTPGSPIDVGEIVLNAPIKAMANNNLPTCTYCMTGVRQEMYNVLNLPPPPVRDMRPVLHNGSAMMIGGAGDPTGILDIGAQLLSNMKPENQQAALGLAAIAVLLTKGKAAPGIIEAEIQAEKNLALGLGDDLFNFAEKKQFHTYRDFSTGFNKSKILDAMNSYDKIHFNTTGFGKIKFSKFDPSGPLTFKNYTNWEMHTIINDPALLKKTVFYNKAADGTYQILHNYSPFY